MTHAGLTEVAYFLHRVGPDGPAREANILRALRWFEWLIEVTDLQIMAPWLPYVLALRESTHRERGLRDGLRMMDQTAIRVGIVCGPELSTGCQADVAGLRRQGCGVIDLTPLGLDLPPLAVEEWRHALAGLVETAAPKPLGAWARPPILHVTAINAYTAERPWV